MADGSETTIIGIDGPPLWATEITAERMADSIDELIQLSRDQKKEIVNQLKKSGTSKTGAQTKPGGGGDEPIKDNLFKSLRIGLKETATSAMDTAAGLDKMPGPLRKFAKELGESSPMFKGALIAVGMFGKTIGESISIVKETVAVQKDLASSGVQISGGYMGIQSHLKNTGQTLAQFSEMTGKYATTISIRGLPALNDLVGEVSKVGKGFATYGLTTAEATEFTAEYLDQQRMAGVFTKMTATAEAAAVRQNIERLTAYSKVLNVSREDMMASRKQALTNADALLQISLLEGEERATATKGLLAISDAATSLGPSFGFVNDALIDFFGHDVDVQAKAWEDLAGAGFADLALELAEIANRAKVTGKVDQEAIKIAIKKQIEDKALMAAGHQAMGERKEMTKKIAEAGLALDGVSMNAIQLEAKFNKESAEVRAKGFDAYKKSVDAQVQEGTNFEDKLQKWQAALDYTKVELFTAFFAEEGKSALVKASEVIGDATTLMLDLSASLAEYLNGKDFAGRMTVLAGALTAFTAALGVAIIGLGLVGAKVVTKTLGKSGAKVGATVAARSGAKAVINSSGKIVAVSAAKKAGKGIMGAGAKTLLKKIPGIGLLLGIGFGVGRLMRGDVVGAGLEVASGAASILPGAGTAASFGLDAINVARDMNRVKAPPESKIAVAPTVEAALSKEAAPTVTTPVAGINSLDLSKLTTAERTNYFLEEILRINRSGFQNMSGDLMSV